MSSSDTSKKDDLAHVAIPTVVYASVEHFSRSLMLRILKAAALRANERGPDDLGKTAVTLDDAMQSARTLFPGLESEFERLLSEVGNQHARTAA